MMIMMMMDQEEIEKEAPLPTVLSFSPIDFNNSNMYAG